MKNENQIFNLNEPSPVFMKQWDEKRTYYHTITKGDDKVKHYIDDGHKISFGGKTYFAIWKNVNGKFIQSDQFYANGLGKLVSQNDILSSMITHVLPQKFIQRVIEFAQRF